MFLIFQASALSCSVAKIMKAQRAQPGANPSMVDEVEAFVNQPAQRDPDLVV
jgi:hypothetical protein